MILDSLSMKNYSVYINEVSLNPLTEESMDVSVRLSVKQKISGPQHSKLPANYSIMLLLSMDGDSINLYNNRNILIDILTSPSMAGKATQVEIIPLTAFHSGKKKKGDFVETTNMNGVQCLSYDTEVHFSVDRNISDLDLFAVSYKTLGAPTTSFLKGGSAPPGLIINNIVSEKILRGGTANTTSTFFISGEINSDPVLWLGDVHQDSQKKWSKGRYYSKSTNPDNSLQSLEVTNTKIKDLRGVEGLRELNISLQRKLFDMRRNNSSELRRQSIGNIQENSHNYLSEIVYSKTVNNKLSYYFAINYLEIIRRNALYANLYSTADELLTTCDVVSMNVVRRRVKAPNYYNKLTAGGPPDRLYDKKIKKVDSDYSILNLNLPNPGILNIVGSDPEMDDITFGLYEYGIEMEIVDKSDQKLVNMSSQLQSALSSLEVLLKNAMLQNNYNAIKDTFSARFLGSLQSEGITPWITCAHLYGDAINLLAGTTNKINNTKLDKIVLDLSKMGDPALYGFRGPQFLIETVQRLISSIDNITNNNSSLSKYASSATTPLSDSQLRRGTRTFKIQQFFQQPFDADWLMSTGLDYFKINETSQINDGPLGQISYERWQEILNNQTGKTGVSLRGANNIYITPNYININFKETKIYRKNALTSSTHELDEATFGLIEASMTRASPLSFGNSVSQLSEKQTNLTEQQTSTLQNQISMMNYNNCEVLLFDGALDTTELAPGSDLCSINQNTGTSELVDSSEMLSDTSKFITNPPDVTLSGNANPDNMNPELSITLSNPVTQINRNNSLITNYLLENDFFNGSQASMTNNLKGLRHGNILKTKNLSVSDYQQILEDRIPVDGPSNSALAAHEYSPPEEVEMVGILAANTLAPENMASFALRYGFIKHVEYLDGYNISNNTVVVSTLIGSPIWKALTPDRFATARDQKRSLICRLRPYSTQLSDFKGLPLSNYNEVFLVGPPSTRPLPLSSPVVTAGRYQMLSSQARTYAGIKEYSISYDARARVGNKPPLSAPLSRATRNRAGELGLLSLKGKTSLNQGHRHDYVIDSAGAGTAKEACDPQHPNVCHTHQIINGVVQPAASVGNPTHTHNLRRAARPSPTRRTTRRTTTRRISTPTAGGSSGPGGSGGRSGGGY